MKNRLTEIIFILDASGSMHPMTEDTIGGFNSLLEKQRAAEGEVLVTTVLFNTAPFCRDDRVPVRAVHPMTRADYAAGGCTALYDAVGETLLRVDRSRDRAGAVPDSTMVVIITDGLENASREWDHTAIRRRIEEKKALGWEFLFLGANIDAERAAAVVGITPDRAVTYRGDAEGTRLNYACVSESLLNMRAGRPIGADWGDRIRRRGR